MKIRYLLTLQMAILASCAFSQLKEGYYLKPTGDSVFSKIEYAFSKNSPTEIKVSENGLLKSFKPESVSGFGLRTGQHFRSKKVTFHTNPIEYTRASAEFSDETKTGVYFLQLIEDGEIALYELVLPERHYYFIEEEGVITELLFRVKYTENEAKEDGTYKTQLFQLLEKYQLLSVNQKLLRNLEYEQNRIAPIIRLINSRSGSAEFSLKKRKLIWISASAGLSVAHFPDALKSLLLNPPHLYQLTPQAKPSFGVSLGVINKSNKKIFISPEVSVSYRSFRINETYIDTSGYNAESYYRQTERFVFDKGELVVGMAPVFYGSVSEHLKMFVKAGAAVVVDITITSLGTSFGGEIVRYDNGQVVRSIGTSYNMGAKNMLVQTFFGVGLQFGKSKLEGAYYPAAKLMKEPAEAQFKAGHIAFMYSYRIFN